MYDKILVAVDHSEISDRAVLAARDLALLFDLLGADRVDVVGYSMGGMVAILAATRDHRVRRLVVGGTRSSIVEQNGLDAKRVPADRVIAALLTDGATRISDPHVAGFRVVADALGADRQALAAVLGTKSTNAGPIPLAAITASTLGSPRTGAPVTPDVVPLHLRKARLTRTSLDANTGICRGMLRHRYTTDGQGEEDR